MTVLVGMVIVSVAAAVPVNSETESGFTADVEFTILGVIEAFKFTLPAKPLRLLRDTMREARLP